MSDVQGLCKLFGSLPGLSNACWWRIFMCLGVYSNQELPAHPSLFLFSLGQSGIAQLFPKHWEGWQWGRCLPAVGNCRSLKASHYVTHWILYRAMRDNWLASSPTGDFYMVLFHQTHPHRVLWLRFQVLRIWCLKLNLAPLLWFPKLLLSYANIQLSIVFVEADTS